MRARVPCRGPSWRGMLGRLLKSDCNTGSPAAMFCLAMDLQAKAVSRKDCGILRVRTVCSGCSHQPKQAFCCTS